MPRSLEAQMKESINGGGLKDKAKVLWSNVSKGYFVASL